MHYERFVRAHKSLYDAFTRLCLMAFLDSLPVESADSVRAIGDRMLKILGLVKVVIS